MSIKACVCCGNVLDYQHVIASPYKLCPSCKSPLDTAAVEGLYPMPSRSDPAYDAKLTAREQAEADVARFQGAPA